MKSKLTTILLSVAVAFGLWLYVITNYTNSSSNSIVYTNIHLTHFNTSKYLVHFNPTNSMSSMPCFMYWSMALCASLMSCA